MPDIYKEKDLYRILLNTYDLIFRTLGKAQFLTDTEIEFLEINILNLSDLIFMKFKNRNITLKMHDVLGKYAFVIFQYDKLVNL